MSGQPIGVSVPQDVRREIAEGGFAWVPGSAWSILPEMERHWLRLCEDWEHLELDRHLKDGARFRQRRYGRYYWAPASGAFSPLPHEGYFQPADENLYAGGTVREFAPLRPATVANPFLDALVRCTFALLPLPDEQARQTWEVRVHQIRIVASPVEAGEPAPEGVHQDGTDFLTLHLIRRLNIRGGESTIYDLARNPLRSYTLREAMDSFLLQDPRILHGVTPVYPADGATLGVRDLLGLDYIYSPDLAPPEEARG